MREQLSRILQIGVEEREEIKHLEVNLINPNPYQPRRYFDPNQLDELANSIKEYGVLQPVIVRRVGANYELVSGERRFRASQLAGLKTVPALIKNLTDKEIAEMALIENLQREDLSYFEEAEGYAKLIREFNITQEEVAKKMGKSQPTVANKLRLLNISPRVRQEISINIITERHARALLKIKDEDTQLLVLDKIYKNNLNVRQTEEYVENLLITKEKNEREQKRKKMIKAVKDMKIFINTIRGAVQTIQDAGMPANIEEKEDNDFIEVVIRLPKNSVDEEQGKKII